MTRSLQRLPAQQAGQADAHAHAGGPPVVVGLYGTVLALLRAGVVRAAFVAPRDEMVAHALQIHEGMAAAVRDRDPEAMAKLLALHTADLERVQDVQRPRRS